MTYLHDEKYNWQTEEKDGAQLYFRGSKKFALETLDITQKQPEDNLPTALEAQLAGLRDFTSGVIETPDHIIAWVDHVRSWPLYYSLKNKNFLISANAHQVQEQAGLTQINGASSLEFAMAGYVTGPHTLYEDLFALQPGEFLIWNKKNSALTVKHFFRYIPDLTGEENEQELIKKLDMVMSRIMKRIIDRANGRPIWIPLSGGLDSRILLCKLHEYGYKNIRTFTYGPRFNFEAKIAKRIANTLNVPWTFVSIPQDKARTSFESEERKNFWRYADGFKAISSMREYEAVIQLHKSGALPDNAVLMNGQSGDYISGGHISQQWTENPSPNMDNFYNQILTKHYGLWPDLLTPENKEIIKTRINELIGEYKNHDNQPTDYARIEEIWEYDARQICLVIHGNRNYDYMGFDWELPLWEKELVDFFQNVPLKNKMGQSLYKKWLQQYNYKGLFPAKEPYIWRWPAHMLWVIPAAKIISIVKGQQAKTDFYARMRYYGHYSNQFAFYSWNEYKKLATKSRNMISLFVRTWMQENPQCMTENVKKGLLL